MTVTVQTEPALAAPAGDARRPTRRRPAVPRCRRAARRTSRPVPCSTASARSTGCPSARASPRSAARWCTRCSNVSTTSRPRSGPSRPLRSSSSRPGPNCGRSPASPSCSRWPRTTARRPTPSAPEAVESWLLSAGKLVEKYFTLEDPTRIQPHGREELVEVTLPDGLLLRGFVDRLDVAPNGALRVVDYKTGAVPREAFEGKALFQMKFYALVLWRTRGVVAAQLKLLYLKDGDALTYAPDEDELSASSAPSWPSGRPSSGRCPPVTSGRTRPGSATGATTRPSARPGAALPRPSRPRPRRRPGGRRCPIVELD